MDQRHVQLEWKRSARCSTGACVEVAHRSGQHLVRDSKLGEASAVLQFGRGSWSAFVDAVKSDEFTA